MPMAPTALEGREGDFGHGDRRAHGGSPYHDLTPGETARGETDLRRVVTVSKVCRKVVTCRDQLKLSSAKWREYRAIASRRPSSSINLLMVFIQARCVGREKSHQGGIETVHVVSQTIGGA